MPKLLERPGMVSRFPDATLLGATEILFRAGAYADCEAAGFAHRAALEGDPDLAAVRADVRFADVLR